MSFSQVWKDVTPVSGSKSFIGSLIVMWASHLQFLRGEFQEISMVITAKSLTICQ